MVKNSMSGDGFNHVHRVHHRLDEDEQFVLSSFFTAIFSIYSFQESPESSNEESHVYMPADVGLTPCLKLRNFFDPDS